MADSGWYPDPSTPGSERYWDGSAWTAHTRAAGQPAAGTVQPYGDTPQYGAAQPYGETPQYGGAQPYGAPQQYGTPQYGGAQPYGAAQQYGGAQPYVAPPAAYAAYGTAAVPRNADIGPRLLAYLIDAGITLAALVVAVIPGFLVSLLIGVSDAFGFLALGLIILGYLAALGFSIWNLVVRQGRTGQTIGKKKMNIMLVGEQTGVPLGIGGAVIRWLLPGALGAISCSIVSTLDLLWPLWDANNQRLIDKWLHYAVVPVPPGAASAATGTAPAGSWS